MDSSPHPWIVVGETVGLTSPTKEAYIERWMAHRDDVVMSHLQGQFKPPSTVDDLEKWWERHVVSGATLLFEVRRATDRQCVGEATLSGIVWPHASADMGLTIFKRDDRAMGYGTEAGKLLVAYAFDGLGLHRVAIDFIAANHAIKAMMAKVGLGNVAGRAREKIWAFGRYQDVISMDLLRSEWPSHPSTGALREFPESGGEKP